MCLLQAVIYVSALRKLNILFKVVDLSVLEIFCLINVSFNCVRSSLLIKTNLEVCSVRLGKHTSALCNVSLKHYWFFFFSFHVITAHLNKLINKLLLFVLQGLMIYKEASIMYAKKIARDSCFKSNTVLMDCFVPSFNQMEHLYIRMNILSFNILIESFIFRLLFFMKPIAFVLRRMISFKCRSF